MPPKDAEVAFWSISLLFNDCETPLTNIYAKNAPKYVWRPGSARTWWGSLRAPPDRPSHNRVGPTSKWRDISIDWRQDGTTSLKYKAQRERRVPNDTFFYWRTNTGNSSLFRHTKRCKFMPKMHQNTFGGRAPPEPAGGGAWALPRSTSHNQGVLLLIALKKSPFADPP